MPSKGGVLPASSIDSNLDRAHQARQVSRPRTIAARGGAATGSAATAAGGGVSPNPQDAASCIAYAGIEGGIAREWEEKGAGLPPLVSGRW